MLIRRLAFLALLSVFMAVPGCAVFQKKVDATIADIDSCIGANESQDMKDLKHAAAQFLWQVCLCDVEGGFSPADLPPCAAAAIPGIEASLGPDGKVFVTCALTKIENDPNALAKQKARAKAMRAKVERS
jgi:hypothetical protein